MPDINKIENIRNLIGKLRTREALSRKKDDGSVIVGFNAAYAAAVHEMIEKHRGKPRKGTHPSGQKKKGK